VILLRGLHVAVFCGFPFRSFLRVRFLGVSLHILLAGCSDCALHRIYRAERPINMFIRCLAELHLSLHVQRFFSRFFLGHLLQNLLVEFFLGLSLQSLLAELFLGLNIQHVIEDICLGVSFQRLLARVFIGVILRGILATLCVSCLQQGISPRELRKFVGLASHALPCFETPLFLQPARLVLLAAALRSSFIKPCFFSCPRRGLLWRRRGLEKQHAV